MHEVFFKFRDFFKKEGMSTDKKILVALSGGADSVATLYLSHLVFHEVEAVHVNHALRGEESDSEEEYCRQLCETFGIPIHVKKLTELEKEGGSQSKYRELRYRFFEEVYQKTDSSLLLVGHHKNDQAETVFYNILKGTGVEGLSGIKPVSENFGMKIARPLLSVSKKQILDFLENQKIEYKTDSSNLKTKYTRNKIRLDVFPMIEKEFNVNLEDSLSNLSETMLEIRDMMEEFNQEIEKERLAEDKKRWILKTEGMYESYPKAVLKNFFLHMLKDTLQLEEVSKEHVNAVYSLKNSENNSYLTLTSGMVCRKKAGMLIFELYEKKEKRESFQTEIIPDGSFHYVPQINASVRFEYVNEEKGEGWFIPLSNKPTSIFLSSYEEGAKISYAPEKRKKVKRLVKEKGMESTDDVWYVKADDEVVFIPQIDYKKYHDSKEKKIWLNMQKREDHSL